VKAGDRAAALTQQLLAFSRRQMTEPRVLGLNALVADAEPMLGRLAGDAVGLVIETNAAPDRVVADPGQLHQILVNLAVNARDAMPQGGRLTIETLTVDEPAGDTAAAGVVPGRSVVVRVSDTGVGMDEAVQARIFEPFFTTKAIGRGTGLGLATVYGIVKHWGGRIRVKSAPGAGTTFDVSLPLTDAPLPVDRPVRRPPPHRGSETVLVVEDRDDVRRLVVRALRACGYQVVEAASGMEAIATSDAHGGPIDLLLTDVVMPGLNGRQLATRLRQQRPGLLVLYMSGYSDERLGDGDELDAGTNYIQKPFTPDDLAARVRAILGQSDGLRRLLVVDAEPAIRALFQRLLASSGCDVLLAADAAEALDIIEGVAQVDVVVIDLDALAPAGRLAAIRERLPAAKAIVMSAAFGAEWRAGAGPMGADAILAKPIDADRLYDALLDVITPGDAADPAAREVARGDATR
jgi:CheY-like chemotaxis protein